MNLLALLGSPRKNGNTSALLDSFLKGAASAGHDAETVFLHDKKIAPCTSCRSCRVDGVGTGVCVIKDDMTELYKKFVAADVIVHGMPIYWWSIPAQTKVFLDRIYALNYAVLKGKKLFLLTTYGGEGHDSGPRLVESSFRDICEFLEMEFGGHMTVFSGKVPVGRNESALGEAFRMGAGI